MATTAKATSFIVIFVSQAPRANVWCTGLGATVPSLEDRFSPDPLSLG
jgi:hypothetical protein